MEKFSRFLFHFDETRLKSLYTGGTYTDLTKLKHTLRASAGLVRLIISVDLLIVPTLRPDLSLDNDRSSNSILGHRPLALKRNGADEARKTHRIDVLM
jgi:hypothetical protein